MKNLFKYTMLIAAAVMAFACSKSDEPAYEVQDQAVKVAIAATSSIEVEGESRATLTPNEEDTYFTAAWETGDQLGLYTNYYILNAEGVLQQNRANSNSSLPYVGDGIFEGEIKAGSGDVVKWDYHAYYPYNANTSNIPFGDRVQNGNNFNGAYDLMSGVVLDVQPEDHGTVLNLDMKRATALVYFHLTNTAEWAQTEKVMRLVLSSDKWFAGPYAKFSNNDYTWSIQSSTGRETEIVMTFEEGTNPTAAELKAYFNIFPSGSSSKLTLTIYTEAHKLVIANPTGKKYEAGMLYKVAKDLTASAWADHNPGPLAAPVINTTPSVDHQSATFSWEAVANATGYAYTIDGGVEQTTTSTSVTISELTPETAYSKTLAVRALGDGADYQDSEPATYTFAFTTEAAPAVGETVVLEYGHDFFGEWKNLKGSEAVLEDFAFDQYLSFYNGSSTKGIKFGTSNSKNRVQFAGSGAANKGALHLKVSGPGTLTVEIQSSGSVSKARTLGVAVDGVAVDEGLLNAVQEQIDTYTVDCSTATANSTIAIYSNNSGINLFYIKWEQK